MRCLPLRRSSIRLFVAALACAASGQALAEQSHLDHNRFKWRDAGGNLHYSDVLPPEAARLGYEIVSPQGLIVKHVERARTAAELSAAKAELAKAQAERDAADARARADAQLLSGYPQESDLKRAQRQKLEMLEQQVTAAQIGLRSQEQVLADMLGRAADAERSGKALSETQAAQLTTMRKQVDEQRLAVARREHERDGAAAQFERETARYRELKAKLAEQQAPAQ